MIGSIPDAWNDEPINMNLLSERRDSQELLRIPQIQPLPIPPPPFPRAQILVIEHMIVHVHEDEPIRIRDRLERYRIFDEKVGVYSPGSGECFADPVIDCSVG